jgi:hypothetical protein
MNVKRIGRLNLAGFLRTIVSYRTCIRSYVSTTCTTRLKKQILLTAGGTFSLSRYPWTTLCASRGISTWQLLSTNHNGLQTIPLSRWASVFRSSHMPPNNTLQTDKGKLAW